MYKILDNSLDIARPFVFPILADGRRSGFSHDRPSADAQRIFYPDMQIMIGQREHNDSS